MTLPFHFTVPLLTSPEIGYVLIRRHSTSHQLLNPRATIHFDHSGVYSNFGAFSTFTAAQSVALQEANNLRKGYDLPNVTTNAKANIGKSQKRQATDTSPEAGRSVHELEIWTVELCPPRSWWLPEPGCEDMLFAQDNPRNQPAVNLPSPVDRLKPTSPTSANSLHDTRDKTQDIASHERDPHFATTKQPLWSRRDYSPSRDTPYAQEMGFVQRTQRVEHRILQIVAEQPDELSEESEGSEMQVNGRVIVNGKPEKEMWYTVEGAGGEPFGPFTLGRRHSLNFPI
ncbi:hypothetical protein K491DRAFT_717472 [Lophiostoma macrostomum CBS 122681]|uniref:Uncharacterized protein n=1 Tax=Lophiostoma macrostomum CBS 122681 TaxID=1314788 RepID=A0A6A6T2Z5_9PLEO|nr:hypothetical protein K491DRAFT_717472 [Lophiostoma macrostomum CBS 122681]